jgi:ABC-2 type transport system permease protein
MLRGLWKLTWLEIKIFVREPMGVIGTLVLPVLLFLVVGKSLGAQRSVSALSRFVHVGLPVFIAVYIALSAVLSLVTIIAIYRESGILKRLRATPLRPQTILGAHVIVKLAFTSVTLVAMIAAGKRYYPVTVDPPLLSFTLALLLASWSVMAVGFVIASIVPTARFAQPIGAIILYPMLAVSGLFVPVASLPHGLQTLARALPLTYVVSLLQGIWVGEPWSAHLGDVAALVIVFALGTALSAKVFRWE